MEKLSPASLARYLPAVRRFFFIAMLGLIAAVCADLESRPVTGKGIKQESARSELGEGRLQEAKTSLEGAEKLWSRHSGLAELRVSPKKAQAAKAAAEQIPSAQS